MAVQEDKSFSKKLSFLTFLSRGFSFSVLVSSKLYFFRIWCGSYFNLSGLVWFNFLFFGLGVVQVLIFRFNINFIIYVSVEHLRARDTREILQRD